MNPPPFELKQVPPSEVTFRNVFHTPGRKRMSFRNYNMSLGNRFPAQELKTARRGFFHVNLECIFSSFLFLITTQEDLIWHKS
jgi:hypothetical protein